jgi:hypothetical protein
MIRWPSLYQESVILRTRRRADFPGSRIKICPNFSGGANEELAKRVWRNPATGAQTYSQELINFLPRVDACSIQDSEIKSLPILSQRSGAIYSAELLNNFSF